MCDFVLFYLKPSALGDLEVLAVCRSVATVTHFMCRGLDWSSTAVLLLNRLPVLLCLN